MQPQRDLRGLWLLLLSVFLLLFEVARAGRSVVSCPANCLCASNILSCSKQQLPNVPQSLPSYTALLDLSHNNLSRLRAEWTPTRLTNLHSLLLSHNHLNFISSEAFVPVPNLRYLDLSSNHLHTLDEFLFSDLQALEVLLLYNNHIVVVDRNAFEDMAQLQKLYLSQNQISRFPVELIKDGNKLPKLMLLDLSSNKLKKLPLTDLQKLPMAGGDKDDGFDRRVAFLEPAGPGQGQNGKLKPGNTLPVPEATGKGQRRMSDPESVSSVFSDTPIVV